MGLARSFIIAFVESTHELMVNHHKVNMKMDYMTDQTDHDSFIIIRLSLKATPAELSGESSAVSFSVWRFCHMRE